MSDKLHIGCGNQILPGWINHDLVPLPQVDVVFDLTQFPWPLETSRFDEILMAHVLEHLPDTVKTLEEMHRISAPGAKITIRVPYWNSPDMMTDPTHKAFFNEHSFEYFDPAERHCQERPYYSTARFKIAQKHYYIKVRRYRRVSTPWKQRILEALARHLGAIIWVIEFDLIVLKEPRQ